MVSGFFWVISSVSLGRFYNYLNWTLCMRIRQLCLINYGINTGQDCLDEEASMPMWGLEMFYDL